MHPNRMMWLAMCLLTLCSRVIGQAEERIWTSAQGGKTIKGELIKVDTDQVTIRRSDGKQFTVSLTKFIEADQVYAANMMARQQAESDIRRHALRFYLILRKPDRAELKEILAAAAQANFESNAGFFDAITPADRGTAPRMKRISIDGEAAEAELSVKLAGKYRDVSMALVKDADERWGILSLSFVDGDGNEKRMEFATGQTVDGDAPPADADATVNMPDQGGVPLPGREPDASPGGPGAIPEPGRPSAAPHDQLGALAPPPHADPPAAGMSEPPTPPTATTQATPASREDPLFPPEPAAAGGSHGHGHGQPKSAGDG